MGTQAQRYPCRWKTLIPKMPGAEQCGRGWTARGRGGSGGREGGQWGGVGIGEGWAVGEGDGWTVEGGALGEGGQ